VGNADIGGRGLGLEKRVPVERFLRCFEGDFDFVTGIKYDSSSSFGAGAGVSGSSCVFKERRAMIVRCDVGNGTEGNGTGWYSITVALPSGSASTSPSPSTSASVLALRLSVSN
jgi:hypothetical protein